MIEDSSSDVLSGEDAFKLSDTFGFPLDLTKEILNEKGMTVDEETFKTLVAQQKKRSKDAHKASGADGWDVAGVVTKGIEATNFDGYTQTECDGKITAIIVDGERVDFLEPDTNAVVVLDTTAFYGEGGGQVGDTGIISNDNFTFEVTATSKTNDGVYLHHGSIVSGESVSVGDSVKATVDADRRAAIARNHTAAHLLQAALRKNLGSHVEQAGQLVNDKVVRFDFSHFAALTPDEIAKIERDVNEFILAANEVTMTEMPIEEAKKMGAMALFGEKYGDVVRVVKAGDFSTELCGGTHVSNSGKLGLFKIISESSVAAGVRRIEGVTGTGVLSYIDSINSLVANTAQVLKVSNVADLEKKASSVMGEIKAKDDEIKALTSELTEIRSGSMFDNAQEIDGLTLITANAGEVSVDELRQLCDKAKSTGENVVAVIAAVNSAKGSANFAVSCGKEAVAKGVKAGDVVRAVAQKAGGNGGGKPDFAMAGAKEIDKIDSALAAANEIVSSLIK